MNLLTYSRGPKDLSASHIQAILGPFLFSFFE